MGCAQLRLNNAEEAAKTLQQSKHIDPTITALNFQLGLAHARLNQLDDAITEFETVAKFEPENISVHFQLSQLLQRAGRAEDAPREMQLHQQALAKHPGALSGPAVFERCKYTQPRTTQPSVFYRLVFQAQYGATLAGMSLPPAQNKV